MWAGLAAACVLISGNPANAQAPGSRQVRQIDPKADELLRKMGTLLAGAKQLHFEAELVFDQITDSGRKLQMSNRLAVDVKRPNRLRAEIRGDTANKRIWYDGRTFTVLEVEPNMYATADAPGTLDAALDAMMDRFGLTLPMADFVFSDPYASLVRQALGGQYVGLHRVYQHDCHHLAFAQSLIDWQIWIDNGQQPLPRKLTITYKDTPGEPQFTAVFLSWNTSAEVDDNSFEFEPPKDAERIEMLSLGTQAKREPSSEGNLVKP